jgi:Family of unknown function (DUF5681)
MGPSLPGRRDDQPHPDHGNHQFRGKPPVRSRFKKERSGNPKGRQKGSKNRVSHRLPFDKLVKLCSRSGRPLLHLAMLGMDE